MSDINPATRIILKELKKPIRKPNNTPITNESTVYRLTETGANLSESDSESYDKDSNN